MAKPSLLERVGNFVGKVFNKLVGNLPVKRESALESEIRAIMEDSSGKTSPSNQQMVDGLNQQIGGPPSLGRRGGTQTIVNLGNGAVGYSDVKTAQAAGVLVGAQATAGSSGGSPGSPSYGAAARSGPNQNCR